MYSYNLLHLKLIIYSTNIGVILGGVYSIYDMCTDYCKGNRRTFKEYLFNNYKHIALGGGLGYLYPITIPMSILYLPYYYKKHYKNNN